MKKMGKKRIVILLPGLCVMLFLATLVWAWYCFDGGQKGEDILAGFSEEQLLGAIERYGLSETGGRFASRTLIVSSDKDVDHLGAVNVLEDGMGNYILQYPDEGSTRTAFEAYLKTDGVRSVEADAVMEISEKPGSGAGMTQANQDNSLSAQKTALQRFLEGREQSELTVAVIDTGYNSNGFYGNRVRNSGANYSQSGEAESIRDDNGHGTAMADIILDNTLDNIRVLPIKAADKNGRATTISIYLGIKKAVEMDASVINISMNAKDTDESAIVRNIINEVSGQGRIIVCSAGNNGGDAEEYVPSNVESAFVIGAEDSDGNMRDFSNDGKTVDYCVCARSTSSASAYASAMIAQVKSACVNMTNEEIKEILDNNIANGRSLEAGEFAICIDKEKEEGRTATDCRAGEPDNTKAFRISETMLEYLLYKAPIGVSYDPTHIYVSGYAFTENDPNPAYEQVILSWEKGNPNSSFAAFWNVWVPSLGNGNVVLDRQDITQYINDSYGSPSVSMGEPYREGSSAYKKVDFSGNALTHEFGSGIGSINSDGSAVDYTGCAWGWINITDCITAWRAWDSTSPTEGAWNEVDCWGGLTHTYTVYPPSSGNSVTVYYEIRTITGKTARVSKTVTFESRKLVIDPNGGTMFSFNGSHTKYPMSKNFFLYQRTDFSLSGINGEYRYSSEKQCVSIPWKEGYEFAGWELTSGDGEISFSIHDGWPDTYWFSGNSTTDVTVKAQWISIYTITLDDTGGSGGSGQIFEKYGSGYYLDSACHHSTRMYDVMRPVVVPEKPNYTFAGYYVGKNGLEKQIIDGEGYILPFTDSTNFRKDTVIYAHWEPNVYTVTLDDNGGSGGSGAIYEKYDTGFYKDDSCKEKISKSNPVNIPEKEGYDFLGYYESKEFNPSETSKISSDGTMEDSITSTTYTSNATLYAQWRIKTYKIQYYSNYQSDGMTDQAYQDTKIHGVDLTMPTMETASGNKDWKKENYHFVGWSTNKKAKTAEYLPGDIFSLNEDTNLYAVWEENQFKVELEAPEEKNPESYYDYSGTLESDICDGIWYKDSVVVRATAICNYAGISNVYLSNPLNNNEYDYKGPDGQTWHEWQYISVDADGNGTTDEAVYVKGYSINKVGKEAQNNKIFYIDYEAPRTFAFSRTFDSLTGTYAVAMRVKDVQSGLAEVSLQSQDDGGNWTDISSIDYRTYEETCGSKEAALANGWYTTEKMEVTAKFDSLPVNTMNYNQLYRLTCRDVVGHESYSDTFTLAPELKMKSSIRKIDGTSAPAGEELELFQYGDMRCWIDVSTEGYAEQLLYVLPSRMHLYPGYGSYTQLTDPSQLDTLPMKDSDREMYKNKFDKYNFYMIPTSNDVQGHASDVFQLEVDESRLELNEVYKIHVYALRGVDYKNNILKVKYIHKRLGHRIIISQSWQAPIFVEWNGIFSWLNIFNNNQE